MKATYLLIIIFGLLLNCNPNDKQKEPVILGIDNSKLYELVNAKDSGVNFINYINETEKMNGLVYEYLYNGGGLSVCDFNGDDLPDIYFIANQRSNVFYLNKGNLQFENVTKTAQLAGNYGFHTGVTTVDINADGLMDIYICKSGGFSNPDLRKNELYVNQGNNDVGIPVFKEEAAKYGLDLGDHSTQAAFFDYDRDGLLDMFLINHGINPGITMFKEEEFMNKKSNYTGEKLFRNTGNTFIDVTEQAGIINNAISFGLGIAIGDLNNDNWPDVLVGHDYYEKDHIYINQKDGTFQEVSSKIVNHISNFSMGNEIADFNNDGLLDFISVDMVSNNNYDIKTSMSGMNPDRFYKLTKIGLHHQYMFNTLQVNNGVKSDGLPVFSDVAQLAGVSNTDWSWAPLFFDMDNDGQKDLFISNGIKRDFRNNDFLIFKNKEVKKLVSDVNMRPEEKNFLTKMHIKKIMMKMPTRKKANSFFINNGDFQFETITSELGIDINSSSNGAAYADLDRDGDLDIVTNNSDDIAFIYKNRLDEFSTHNNYLQIKLKGDRSNPFGVGTRVCVWSNGQLQVQEQYLTRGFQSSVDYILHFGLGRKLLVDSLTVTWPDGKIQYLTNIKINKIQVLKYIEATNTPLKKHTNRSIFTDVTTQSKLQFKHKENVYNDFEREGLLPHQMSRFGPALAVADVNGDALDDVYLGGAKGQESGLYIQNLDGSFRKVKSNVWKKEKDFEDVSAIFFDADGDGDNDLLVVSGGNEWENGSKYYQDRFYLNKGKEIFEKINGALPNIRMSGAVVKTSDFDLDGDLDLFLGGRQIPGKYPHPTDSYLLENNSSIHNVSFIDVTDIKAPFLKKLGMVTDAVWCNINNDEYPDLAVTGEWMPVNLFINNGKLFKNITNNSGLQNDIGWWFSIASADFDNDGDMDFIAGNMGLNYKYKASMDAPFEVYQNDFDANGSSDIVLGFHEKGKLYPLRGLQCSSNQMPFLKKKFKTYNAFGNALLKDIYDENAIQQSLNYKATNFASCYLENNGDGTFTSKQLPMNAQFSSVNSILIDDYDEDGNLDVLLSGNLYVSEVETPRNDASYGLLLKGNGKGDFNALSSTESGLFIQGDTKHSAHLNNALEKRVIFVKNNDTVQIIKKRIK